MSNSEAARKTPRKLARAQSSQQPLERKRRNPSPAAPARTHQERSDAMRKRLVIAGAEVMRKRGFAGFRPGAVADAAGVSRGAMLHHFPKKRDLIVATHSYLFDLALEKSRSRAKLAQTSENILEDVIADAQEFFFGKHFFSLLDIVVSSSTEPSVRKDILVISRETRLPVEAAWREVLTAHMPQAAADDILALTLSLVRGLAIRTIWDNDPDRFEKLLAVWRRMVRAYLGEYTKKKRA